MMKTEELMLARSLLPDLGGTLRDIHGVLKSDSLASGAYRQLIDDYNALSDYCDQMADVSKQIADVSKHQSSRIKELEGTIDDLEDETREVKAGCSLLRGKLFDSEHELLRAMRSDDNHEAIRHFLFLRLFRSARNEISHDAVANADVPAACRAANKEIVLRAEIARRILYDSNELNRLGGCVFQHISTQGAPPGEAWARLATVFERQVDTVKSGDKLSSMLQSNNCWRDMAAQIPDSIFYEGSCIPNPMRMPLHGLVSAIENDVPQWIRDNYAPDYHYGSPVNIITDDVFCILSNSLLLRATPEDDRRLQWLRTQYLAPDHPQSEPDANPFAITV